MARKPDPPDPTLEQISVLTATIRRSWSVEERAAREAAGRVAWRLPTFGVVRHGEENIYRPVG